MSYRRHKMMQSKNPYDEYGYIKNGKIFHLDGIDKGETSGAWTDLIGGWVFSPSGNVTFNDDNIQISSNGYLSHNGLMDGNRNATIEVVATMSTGSLITLGIGRFPYICFYNDNGNICFLQNGNLYKITNDNNVHAISLNLNTGLYDGTTITKLSSIDYWANDGGYSYIGKRSRGNYYTGKIHSIRIYNRQLSNKEQLHNQQIDNVRFNLGLTI